MTSSQIRVFIVFLFLLGSLTCFSQNLDINILKDINPSVPNSSFWRGVSSSVAPVVIGLPVGMYLVNHLDKNHKGEVTSFHIAGGIVTAMLLTQSFKYLVHRERPFITYPLDVHPFDAGDITPSFPSQHTSFAFATATALSLQYHRWYVVVPAYAWASAVGYSRLYLGEHYPSDVIAGAALGTGSAILSAWLTKKIWREKK